MAAQLEITQIDLGDTSVDVVLKDIKNVHLSVHPPSGRVLCGMKIGRIKLCHPSIRRH